MVVLVDTDQTTQPIVYVHIGPVPVSRIYPGCRFGVVVNEVDLAIAIRANVPAIGQCVSIVCGRGGRRGRDRIYGGAGRRRQGA